MLKNASSASAYFRFVAASPMQPVTTLACLLGLLRIVCLAQRKYRTNHNPIIAVC